MTSKKTQASKSSWHGVLGGTPKVKKQMNRGPIEFFDPDERLIKTCWFADDAGRILHREDGPAVKYANGDEYWYMNNRFHRIGGPAIILPYRKEWWLNGRIHREDGPAIIYEKNGLQNHYIEFRLFNEYIKEEDFTPETIRKMRLIHIIET